MTPDWERQFDGWDERCNSFALFLVMADLQRKRLFDIDHLALGLVALLYILDRMLDGEHCPETNVERHIAAVVRAKFYAGITDDQMAHLWRSLRDHLQNGGTAFTQEFPDLRPEASPGAIYTVKFHLVETYRPPTVEDGNRPICLRLSEQGLDLLFKTKELHRELGISITQLLFRQQMSRGTFEGALRVLRELSLEVQQRIESIERFNRRIFQEVHRVRAEEVDEMWHSMCDLARREKAAFMDIRGLVGEARVHIEQMPRLSARDRENLSTLAEIDRRLSRVLEEHSQITTLASVTGRSHLTAIERAMGRSFTANIDLRTEVVEPLAAGTYKVEGLLPLVRSLARPVVHPLFSPLRAFEPQYLPRNQANVSGGDVVELSAEEAEAQEERERQALRDRVRRLADRFEPVTLALMEGPEVRLSTVLSGMGESERDTWLLDKDIHYLLQILQRMEAVDFIPLLEVDPHFLAQQSPELAAVALLLGRWPAWADTADGFVMLADGHQWVQIPGGGYISDICMERWQRNGSVIQRTGSE